ncbi:extracellular solute-binding protein [Curtobacterium sp. MCBD17_040]|uniref:ABC transporter substrate-binding protein n=1 Tax=Curtobacterium sp. MCBD17_040 TaxID=2175674 RepID=UPI0021AC4056|nr:extracellular solute-binding protein [Curtobacterium sp. MCBD17_040]WIB64911.1 extracellular solute-binding protein [Curtobacterium sp. MCBD17_040]
MRRPRSAALALGAIAVTITLALTGCSPSSTSGGSTKAVSQSDIDKAMNTPTTLTFWTWVPDIQNEVNLFEKKYPKIKVNVVNTTGGSQHYPKVRAALKAGKGVPDVAQMEYDYIPSFTQTKSLLDLTPYGGAKLEDEYTDWVWNQVDQNGGVWGIPQDSGPLGTLYRKDIFDKAGAAAPKTWSAFASAAQQVKSKTGSYITDLPGNDMFQMISFFWQKGAKPFSYDGKKTVGIDLDSKADQQVVSYWQDLIDKDLVATDPDFTDDYYQGLSRDKYASWLVAAWGPVFLQGTAKNTSGKWAAADIPQWQAGQNVSGNWGGSSDAVMAATKHPIQAYELAKFINNDQQSTLKLANEQYLFPTKKSTLTDDSFTSQKSAFYGGQQVNQFFAGVSDTVDKKFEWLPFMDYVNSSYANTLGKAISNHGDLTAALATWQSQVTSYAKQQGFTVK